jgi:hypothetical protein
VKDTESQLARLVLAPASISRDHPWPPLVRSVPSNF